MAELSPLDQVRLDAERITLKRIQEAKEQKEWQESQDRAVTFDEGPVEAAVEVEAVAKAPKVVKTKKGK